MTEKVFILDSDSKHLKPFREGMEKFLCGVGFSLKDREDILVALGEAVANCMRHAYQGEAGHEIRVTAQDSPDRVLFKVRDFGKKIDLSLIKPPELPPTKPHGLGIYFMQTIMSEVQYNTSNAEGNELIMTKLKEKGASREDSNKNR